MKKKTMLAVLVLSFLSIGAANAQVWGYQFAEAGHEHDCDAKELTAEVHNEHGNNGCSNTTDITTGGVPAACQDWGTSGTGRLTHGEWMTCNATSGPTVSGHSTPGCDFQVVTSCGGTIRTGEIRVPLGSDGGYPACYHVNDGQAQAHGIACQRLTSGHWPGLPGSGTHVVYGCSCDDSSGTWSCTQ